jgi:prepilin-type N-terminal cleavage/methylation domain-containing protein
MVSNRIIRDSVGCRWFGSRRGMTLIELLAVISIIGLLSLLITSAVLASRESARRTQCVNHLKQIGTAIAQFESVHRVFPASVTDKSQAGKNFPGVELLSVHTQILPYLEQKTLYDSINFNPNETMKVPAYDNPLNVTAQETRVGMFLCPSDHISQLPGNSYRANIGPYPQDTEGDNILDRSGGGSFRALRPTTVSSITDGLSMTAGFSERLVGSGSQEFHRDLDLWYTGLEDAIRGSVTSDELVEICAVAVRNPSDFFASLGRYWMPGRYADTTYNHVAKPNAPFPDCVMHQKLYEGRPPLNDATLTARSRHSGGVHVMLMDASVRFVKDSIDLASWRALATRAGGETIGDY